MLCCGKQPSEAHSNRVVADPTICMFLPMYLVHNSYGHSTYTPAPNLSPEQHATASCFFPPNASLLSVSTSVPPCLTPLGTLEWLGGMSRHGFRVKKLRGLRSSVIGSAGMTGKSSGLGKCVIPKVCQSTTSVLTKLAVGFDSIHAGIPCDGSPDV
jgi:hypothetical protein